jgi:5S rRNA maturation endonuclease (ribonuclease M5)
MSVPIDQRVIRRTRASDFYSYSGLLRNVISERLLYVAILKELVDNALDSEPALVSVTFKCRPNSLAMTVASDGKPFPAKAIRRTFSSYDYFTSAKFWKKLLRGTLGNALKVVSGAPVALAERFGYPRPKILVTVRSVGSSYEIMAPDPGDCEPAIHRTGEGISAGTETSLTLPYDIAHDYAYEDAHEYWRNVLMPAYFVFNPEIEFDARTTYDSSRLRHLDWRIRLKPVGKPQIYGGLSSVHWYTKGDFRRLMRDLEGTASAYGAITLREFLSRLRGFSSPDSQRSLLQSSRLGMYSFEQVAKSERLSEKLYETAKSTIEAPSAESLGSIGRHAMHRALTQIFGKNLRSFHYYQSAGADSLDGCQVPYVIEAGFARVTGATFHQFYGVNRTPFPLTNHSDTHEDPFEGVRWEWKTNRGKRESAYSLGSLLERFDLKKGEGAVVVLHVLCPNLNVKDYAKSTYDFSPTGSYIAQALYEVCRYYPRERFKGAGGKSVAVQHLEKELERRQSVLKEKNVIPPEEWTTQQGLFYKVRNEMGGYVDAQRDSFIAAILRTCRKMGGGDSSYREKLGIKAAVRAQFFHRGQEHAVSFDSIEWLSDKGSDLILIEKEGVAEILAPYAKRRGFAIVNTRGFAAEYAKQIMKLAEVRKGNVFVLTDWDDSGLVMAHNLQGFVRIGVDNKMIVEAGKHAGRSLQKKDVEEAYKPSRKHYLSLPDDEKKDVANTRVEIDALLAAVGPEALWKTIEAAIAQNARVRDLTRSIAPQIQLLEYISDPLERIRQAALDTGKPLLEKRMKRIRTWRGALVEVDEVERSIEKAVLDDLRQERKLRKIAPLLKKAAMLLGQATG